LFIAADINAIKAGQDAKPISITLGQCLPDTNIVFNKNKDSFINLTGNCKG
jgi:hypothetical protein